MKPILLPLMSCGLVLAASYSQAQIQHGFGPIMTEIRTAKNLDATVLERLDRSLATSRAGAWFIDAPNYWTCNTDLYILEHYLDKKANHGASDQTRRVAREGLFRLIAFLRTMRYRPWRRSPPGSEDTAVGMYLQLSIIDNAMRDIQRSDPHAFAMPPPIASYQEAVHDLRAQIVYHKVDLRKCKLRYERELRLAYGLHLRD